MSEAHYYNDLTYFEAIENIEIVDVFVCKFCREEYEIIDECEYPVRSTYHKVSLHIEEQFNENHDYCCESCKESQNKC